MKHAVNEETRIGRGFSRMGRMLADLFLIRVYPLNPCKSASYFFYLFSRGSGGSLIRGFYAESVEAFSPGFDAKLRTLGWAVMLAFTTL
jgi:hypothetical protein